LTLKEKFNKGIMTISGSDRFGAKSYAGEGKRRCGRVPPRSMGVISFRPQVASVVKRKGLLKGGKRGR